MRGFGKIAFQERVKIHDLAMEDIDTVLPRWGIGLLKISRPSGRGKEEYGPPFPPDKAARDVRESWCPAFPCGAWHHGLAWRAASGQT